MMEEPTREGPRPTPLAVLDAVEDLIRRELGPRGTIRPDSDLVEDLGLDSLGLLTLTVALENHFQVCLEPESEGSLRRVADVVALIVEHLDAAHVDHGPECGR